MPKNVESVAEQRQHLVPLGLLPEQLLELFDLVGVLGGKVVGLGEVVGEVVQLGGTGIRVPDARRVRRERFGGEHPRDALGLHREPPAVLVHAAVADGLEVLLGAVFGRAGIGERRGERGAVHRFLFDSVDSLGLRDAGDVEDRGRHVDDVGELGAQPACSWMRSGQCTTNGLRVPPRCEPTCLPHWNGVLPAHAHAAP